MKRCPYIFNFSDVIKRHS